MVGQSSHLAIIPLEEPDFAAAHAKAPPVHLLLPKEHATHVVPDEGGVLEPHVPSMRALQQVREVVWNPLALRAPGPTRRWLVLVKLCLWERCIMALRTET